MKWIGLTGGIATGKSAVTGILRTLGYVVLDADEVSHAVTAIGSPSLPKIFALFGEGLRNPDGSLDRRALGQIVFGKPEQLRKLEEIVHPLVMSQVAAEKKRLEQAGTKVAFYDVPLLFEKKMQTSFDDVILVSTSEQQQAERLMKRNGLSLQEVQARLQSQLPLSEKRRLTHHVIENSGDFVFLEQEVRRVLSRMGL